MNQVRQCEKILHRESCSSTELPTVQDLPRNTSRSDTEDILLDTSYVIVPGTGTRSGNLRITYPNSLSTDIQLNRVPVVVVDTELSARAQASHIEEDQ